MLIEFVEFIKRENLFSKKATVLLAVSGGSDSMAMLRLFKSAGFKFGVAHCNFKLRGKESDADEDFVRKIAKEEGVDFYTTCFDTEKHAKEEGISIQMAARELRYQWFEKIRSEYAYTYISLAHHQDDVIETFFINLLRGTGISGLHGILPKNGLLIRPLLFLSKDQILNYCAKNKIKYREDTSNESVKYTRNKIRHQLMPLFKEINPSFKETIINNIGHLKITESIYLDHLKEKAKSVFKNTKGKVFLSIKEIDKLNYRVNYLYEFLKPYDFNFSTAEDISLSLNKISGKVFNSPTHRLLRDRDYLLVERINKAEQTQIIVEKNTSQIALKSSIISFKKVKKENALFMNKEPSYAYLDFDKLQFPLIIRKWEHGDWFYPLGMKRKKKLSDFFIDNKISLFEKEKILVLCSGNDIVWVIGQRINNQYKIVQETKKMYIAQIL